MTIQGAMNELINLLKADDIPIYYKGVIEKVIETIDDYVKRKTEPIPHDDYVETENDYLEKIRLIDADALMLHLADYQLQESPNWGANGYGNADRYEAITDCINAVDFAQTIDAVEVVRCRDCKHRRTEDCPMCNECGRKAYPTADDDFCCYGEREGE